MLGGGYLKAHQVQKHQVQTCLGIWVYLMFSSVPRSLISITLTEGTSESQLNGWVVKVIKAHQGFLMRTKENRKDAPSVAIVIRAHIFLQPHWEAFKKTQCMFSVKAERSFISWEKRAQCGCLNTPLIIVEWHICWIHIRHLWESLLQQLRGKTTSASIYHIVLVKLSSHIN